MYDLSLARVHCLQDLLFNKRKGFSRDLHVPDLLLFSPQTTFNNDPLYLSGKIILQDKASCFPAIVLSPPATDESVVIDATAAPGNKTSHLSALMENKGKVTPKKGICRILLSYLHLVIRLRTRPKTLLHPQYDAF